MVLIKGNFPNEEDKLKPNGGGLLIKNNTKQGYSIAENGDGIDISGRMEYHRGNVQKDTIQTLTCSGGNDRGVVVKKNE